jgi:hypothetical protein
MRTLKRLGASVLTMGVAVTGLVMTASVASAHTGTLTTSAVCNDDGTYQITYTGQTANVPPTGPGHVATLTVGEVKPDGSTITDVPPTVTGNTAYTFHQIVAGKTTHAQATAFLTWGDGAKSDPIGKIDLPGNCTAPVAPSGDLKADCVDGGGHVVAGKLDNGTAENVTWRLVSGTEGSHHTVVGGPTSSSGPLEATGLDEPTKVWLQYSVGEDNWVDEGSVVTTDECSTPVVSPAGSFTVVCTEAGAKVTIGTLTSGSMQGVVWTLTYGSASQTVTSGDVVAVPARAALALKFTAGDNTSGTVQTGTAPESCGTAVLGEHHSHQPAANQPTAVLGVSLARTGAPAQLPWTLGFAALFLVVGSALIFLTRRPEAARVPSSDQN